MTCCLQCICKFFLNIAETADFDSIAFRNNSVLQLPASCSYAFSLASSVGRLTVFRPMVGPCFVRLLHLMRQIDRG